MGLAELQQGRGLSVGPLRQGRGVPLVYWGDALQGKQGVPIVHRGDMLREEQGVPLAVGGDPQGLVGRSACVPKPLKMVS
jgi:hypothetical protein